MLGVEAGDTDTDVSYIAGKIADLRLFPADDADDTGMERSLLETGGSVLLISQFN